MMRRVFLDISPTDSAGKAAVDAYFESKRSRTPLAVNCKASASVAFPVDVVWQVILETQHLGTWLEDSELGDRPLPEKFGRGFCINPGRGPTYVIDCGESNTPNMNRLTFQRHFYVDQEPFSYTVALKPYERFSSMLSIQAEGPQSPNRSAGLLGKIFGGIASDKTYVSTATKELTERLNRAVKRLAHLCWDRTHYGATHRDYEHAGRWLVWHYGGDTLKYYENKNGHLGPELGELINSGERIGFVQGSNDARDISYWKENNYIEPGNGYVAEISKRHGDRIEIGDRILLITKQNGADLSVADIQVDHLDLHTRQSIVLEKYTVSVGQSVQQGDLVATVRSRYGNDRFAVMSKYEGVIVELTKSPGEPMTDRFPWESVARIKATRISV